jgi:GTP-binding protein Era
MIIDITDPKLDFLGFQDGINHMDIPLLIALNKIDLSNQTELERHMERIKVVFPKSEIYPISALHTFGLDMLRNRIIELLPENPPYFDKDALTDRPMRFFASEIIRERILENYQKEIPYSVEVEIETYKEEENLVRIAAVIYVSRKSQKGILIGHKGEKLKKVGTEARKLMEEFIGNKVFLELFVKVDEDWRNKSNRLKAFGYKS